MSRRAFALAVACWALVVLAWPDLKLGLGVLGGSPGSQSQGANLFLAEAGALVLGAWLFLNPALRGRVPAWAWGWSAAWAALILVGAAWGLHRGWHPRDVAAEARCATLALALLAFSALDQDGRRLLRLGLLGGSALWALQQVLLLALEPTGLANLNIVPVPVLATVHDLGTQALGAFVLLGAGLVWAQRRGSEARWICLGLWTVLWLSLVRGLWSALPLALGAAALVLARKQGVFSALAWSARQALMGSASLLLLLLFLRVAAPDSAFLLGFRLLRTAQALHLEPAGELQRCGPCGTLLTKVVARGGLYHSLQDQDRGLAQSAPGQDPSGADRGLMLHGAWDAFRRSPWLGEGLGALLRYRATPTIERVQRDPHSGWAWLPWKLGVLGLLFAAFAAAALVRGLWQSPAPPRAVAFGAGLLVLIAALEAFHVGLLEPSFSLACLAWAQTWRRHDHA